MSYVEHAKSELAILREQLPDLAWNENVDAAVITLMEALSTNGDSGGSAPYVHAMLSDIFKKLFAFQPLTPLTGEDDEWNDVSEYSDGGIMYQNRRCSSVFKGGDGNCWDIDGKVFEEPDGCRYTSRECFVDITFPYTPTREVVLVPFSEDRLIEMEKDKSGIYAYEVVCTQTTGESEITPRSHVVMAPPLAPEPFPPRQTKNNSR
jgi:hypothetical protein